MKNCITFGGVVQVVDQVQEGGLNIEVVTREIPAKNVLNLPEQYIPLSMHDPANQARFVIVVNYCVRVFQRYPQNWALVRFVALSVCR